MKKEKACSKTIYEKVEEGLAYNSEALSLIKEPFYYNHWEMQ